MTEAGRLLTSSPHLHSSLTQFITPSCERCPHYTQGKGASWSQKTKGCSKESNKQALVNFPSVLQIPHVLDPIIVFHDCTLSIQPNKMRRSVLLGLHFLMKAALSHKTHIK